MLIAYEGFWVDVEAGRLYGVRRQPLKGSLNRDGYRFSHRSSGHYYWHRMVWGAANGPIPAGMEINHINGVKDDNRLCNLELVTRAQNIQHAFRLGLLDKRGEKHPGHKLTEAQVLRIRELRASGRTLREIGAEYGVSLQTIHDIATRKSWRHLREVS